MPEAAARRLIIALGLYRSASTWTYNVLLAILGDTAVAFYGDRLSDLADRLVGVDRVAIVKCHLPDAATRLLIDVGRLPVILTVREPLDCIASLMTQFDASFDEAWSSVERSAACILSTLACCRPLILRYEDDDRGSRTVSDIAERVGVDLEPAKATRIAEALEPVRVKAFIDQLASQGGFGRHVTSASFDEKTHWHPNHVGSGRSDRYPEVLSASQIARVVYGLRPFRHAFGYEASRDRPPISRGAHLSFDLDGDGIRYCDGGFGKQEAIGLWTEDRLARLTLPLTGPASTLAITLFGHFSAALSAEAGASMHVAVNGTRAASISDVSSFHDQEVSVVRDIEPSDVIVLEFEFDALRSAADLGLSLDGRPLGFYLVGIGLDYGPA